MNETCINLAESYGTDLSNRRRAAVLRRQIISAASTTRFVLDFSGVRTVSDSFADELFGVLFSERGEEWFRTTLKLANLSQDVRNTILGVIQDRIDRLSPA